MSRRMGIKIVIMPTDFREADTNLMQFYEMNDGGLTTIITDEEAVEKRMTDPEMLLQAKEKVELLDNGDGTYSLKIGVFRGKPKLTKVEVPPTAWAKRGKPGQADSELNPVYKALLSGIDLNLGATRPIDPRFIPKVDRSTMRLRVKEMFDLGLKEGHIIEPEPGKESDIGWGVYARIQRDFPKWLDTEEAFKIAMDVFRERNPIAYYNTFSALENGATTRAMKAGLQRLGFPATPFHQDEYANRKAQLQEIAKLTPKKDED